MHAFIEENTDLFGPVPTPPTRAGCAEFVGTLAAVPQIRTRSDHGKPTQVLCLELQEVSEYGCTLHAELPFDEAHRKQALQQATALRPGQRIAITSTANDVQVHVRVCLLHATNVAVVDAPAATTR